MKILSFGEIIWDIYENEKFIGGAPLNLAAHCSKQGADSFMLSSVGNDDLGTSALEIVKKFNVKTDFVSVNNEKETGKCIVTLNENGVPSYTGNQIQAYIENNKKMGELFTECQNVLGKVFNKHDFDNVIHLKEY